MTTLWHGWHGLVQELVVSLEPVMLWGHDIYVENWVHGILEPPQSLSTSPNQAAHETASPSTFEIGSSTHSCCWRGMHARMYACMCMYIRI